MGGKKQMRRLRKRRLAYLAKRSFKDLRKRRMIFAEWMSSDPSDPNLVQNITDIMAVGGQIQIQYNGEYKNILPYGWNSSKDGNVLLMCYKDTGEVRSYRLDRITEVLFDSENLPMNMQYENDQTMGDQLENDMGDIPDLPDDSTDEFSTEEQSEFGVPNEQELPFDEALDIMDENIEQPIDEFSSENVDENEIHQDQQIQDQNQEEENQEQIV